MTPESIAIVAALVAGAVILSLALLRVRSLLELLEREHSRQYWVGAGILLALFPACYVGGAALVATGRADLLVPVAGGIGLLVAVFAFLVVAAGQTTIEELVRSRDQLERREEEFERLYEATDVLNRVLRHNLRNNMNVILGRSDMIDDDSEDGPEHVEAIQAEAQRIVEIGEKARVIQDTLDADVDPRVRPAESFLDDAVERVRQTFPDATVDVAADADCWIAANHHLGTAIENVLDNAVRHNDGPATVTLGVECDDADVCIEIADDGPGIHPDEVRAVTEQRETPLQHGSGLGLWLASWIVDRHDGEIEFDENDPRGTVVRFRLPAAEPPEPAADAESESGEIAD